MRKTILAFMTAVLLAGNSNAVYASGMPDVEAMETFETEALATEGESEASALPEEYTSHMLRQLRGRAHMGPAGHLRPWQYQNPISGRRD